MMKVITIDSIFVLLDFISICSSLGHNLKHGWKWAKWFFFKPFRNLTKRGILRQENGWEEALDAVRPKIQEICSHGTAKMSHGVCVCVEAVQTPWCFAFPFFFRKRVGKHTVPKGGRDRKRRKSGSTMINQEKEKIAHRPLANVSLYPDPSRDQHTHTHSHNYNVQMIANCRQNQ